VLHQTFGSRVIGLQIGRSGDGMTHAWWPVKGGACTSTISDEPV
jgi:hypothetical protein